MKKALLASLMLSLAAATASATQIWYDVITNYPGGCITTNTSAPTGWYAHYPGTITATDALILTNTYTSGAAFSNGRRLRINGLNSEYIMRIFDPVATNSIYGGSVYASFIANASFVPTAGVGTYFACFDNVDTNNPPVAITNGFDFRGRIYQIGNTNAYPFTTTVANTFRYGIANAEGDPAQSNPGPWAYVPFDLVKSVDVQVVLKYDIDALIAYLYINPAQGDENNSAAYAASGDFASVLNGLGGLLFRQRTAGGTVDIRDVAVGTAFADVVTNVAATSPVLVATNYNVVTNYAGNPGLLEVFPTSLGGGTLSYQWYRSASPNDIAVSGTSQTYVVSSMGSGDIGYYYCAVTNSSGTQGAHSTTNFHIGVNLVATPPYFTSKPSAATNGTVGTSMSLSAAAAGSGPLTYAWSLNGTQLQDGTTATIPTAPGDSSVVSGSATPNLTVSSMSTNETGTYTLVVTSGAGGLPYSTTNTTVVATISPARAVTIAYLRSLEDTNPLDTTYWQVTDTGDIFTVSNAVCTIYTNTTSGVTASYYVQDASGCGLNLFVTGDASFRPQMGDLVSFSGTLSSYNNSIETDIISGAPYQFYGVTGHTNVLPAPVVFALAYTNNLALMETNLEGRLAMLTNVYFTYTHATQTNLTGNINAYVTNNTPGSVPLNVYFPGSYDNDLTNHILNKFAYTITGVLSQYKTGAYANSGYELIVTRIGDVVATPPPPVTDLTATVSGNNVVLSWTAVPYTAATRGAYSYSVFASSDPTQPFSTWTPLSTGTAFSLPGASFTHTNALLSGSQMYYRVVSP